MAKTVTRPTGMFRSPGARRSAAPLWDPEAVTPAGRGEGTPFLAAGVVLGFFALLVCYRKGYLLLYGDAVAHLAIARRILDARWPGLSQLGGVWLPLPHLLELPFVQSLPMWQSGMGGAPMSILSFAASLAGMWRLARRLMRPRWALVAVTFYALNANLLFLASTAMTEALFLGLLVWTVVMTMEGIGALESGNSRVAKVRMMWAGVFILLQVFTRYDGWIVGAVVWGCFAWALLRAALNQRRQMRTVFVVFTLLCLAGPLLWFWYNLHFQGDWLDFLRGPYSAKQIERKTAPPGQHYRGWHNMGWALVFYTRTAQVDAAASETGFALMAAALYGLWAQLRYGGARGLSTAPPKHDAAESPPGPPPGATIGRTQSGHAASVLAHNVRSPLPGSWLALLLWVPLPFYVYSVAYGSVPIFIPQLWPHSFYNARYGMELLPALAVYAALAGERFDVWLRAGAAAWQKISGRLLQPAAMMLCAANCLGMMYRTPLVLREGIVNALTRVPFEHALAGELEQMPYNEPVMMAVSAHVGAVQVAGRTLKSMVSENDNDSWQVALRDPAAHAAYVISIAGDPVERAVQAHPAGLEELAVICTTGQPCAKVYRSTEWKPGPPQP